MKRRRIIWTSHCDFKDWESDLKECNPDMTDEELIDEMYRMNDDYLDDERQNLDIVLENSILIIGDLGLWNGRRQGYKELDSANIADCLHSQCDYLTWWVDDVGDLRCEAVHHDGTNYYTYREWKPNVTEAQKEELRDKLYNGTALRTDIVKYTRRIGDAIAAVYGWKLPGRPVKRYRKAC